MDALGRLAGGLAHDFNNLLTVISVYTDLLLNRRNRHNQLERYAGEIKKAVDNATTLTSQLLTLSRKQMLPPTAGRPQCRDRQAGGHYTANGRSSDPAGNRA